MSTKQMVPPSDGAHGTVSFLGRTYSSAPGVSIAVPDFDAGTLEANGWEDVSVTLATTPVAPSISGTPQLGHSLIASPGSPRSPGNFSYQWTRNGYPILGAVGRTYTITAADLGSLIGVSITPAPATAPPSTAVLSPVTGFSTLTVPSGALAVYSVIQTTGWTGSCLRVQRASDSTQQDIGFSGNVVDWAAADSFAAGSALTVVTWYDQSGNGKNMTAVTFGPDFTMASNLRGIRPITFDYTGANFPNLSNAALTFGCNLFTLYCVHSPRSNYGKLAVIEINDATQAVNYVSATHNGGLLGLKTGFPTSGVVDTGILPPGVPHYLAISSGATAFVDVDGVQAARSASGVQAAGALRIKALAGDTARTPFGDYFLVALYGAAHDGPTAAANGAAFKSAFMPMSPTKRLVYDGSSIPFGFVGTKAINTPFAAGFGRSAADTKYWAGSGLDNWDVVMLAYPNKTLTNSYDERTFIIPKSFNAARAMHIYLPTAATNDIALATYTDANNAMAAMDSLYSGKLLPLIAYVMSQGYTGVVCPTVIARVSMTDANFKETARTYWNAKLIAGAAANGYIVSDRAADQRFDQQSDTSNLTWYFTDGIHLNDAGVEAIGLIDRAAILSF